MSHQQNHLAKTRKNIFDKSIAQVLAELDYAIMTIDGVKYCLERGYTRQQILEYVEEKLQELEQMKQNRG